MMFFPELTDRDISEALNDSEFDFTDDDSDEDPAYVPPDVHQTACIHNDSDSFSSDEQEYASSSNTPSPALSSSSNFVSIARTQTRGRSGSALRARARGRGRGAGRPQSHCLRDKWL